MINSLIHGAIPPSVVAEALESGLANRELGPNVGGGAFAPDRAPLHTADVRYVDADVGNDLFSGLDAGNAWLSLGKGLAWLQRMEGMNRSAILEIKGDFDASGQLDIGGFDIGATDGTYDFGATGPDNFVFKTQRQIRARMVEVTTVTIGAVTTDAVTGLCTSVAVAENLTAHAHRGQFLAGQGVFEYTAISDNAGGAGTSTLRLPVSFAPDGWTGAVKIYRCGASITAGVNGDSSSLATRLLANTDWSFCGIEFKATDNASQRCALSVYGSSIVNFQMCAFEGLQLSGGYSVLYACYIHDELMTVDGGSLLFLNSVLYGLDFLFHHGGSFADVNECMVDACNDPFGGGVVLGHFMFSSSASHYENAVGVSGVRIAHGISRLTNCRCGGNAVDGVEVSDGAQAILANVAGTGNGAYGCRITNGSQVRASGGTAVTGTTADILLGGAGSKAWSDAPATDVGAGNPQFCRVS